MQVVDLLSQLEEPKFLRLFRHLITLPSDKLPDNLCLPPAALDIADAEVVARTVGEVSALRSWATTWVFQIEHAPPILWSDNDFFDHFVEKRLKAAFRNLRKKEDPLSFLHGEFNSNSDRPVQYPIAQGLDYYFFTNICSDLGEDALRRFSEKAHRIFENVLGIPSEKHPTFGIGTPQTAFNQDEAAIKEFALSLLNMPSSYYLMAREGRISVFASAEHGWFDASAGANAVGRASERRLATVATSSLPIFDQRLAELEALINSPSTKEADLQEFFRAYPQFLFALDERYCEIKPHVCLVDQRRNRLVPDFMARIESEQIWEVIELKRPQHAFVGDTKDLERLSAFAARGIAQLLEYRDFFASRSNRNRVSNSFGSAPYEPALVLVIGRGRARDPLHWTAVTPGFPSVKVVSYDYLFQRAQECRAYLSGLQQKTSR